MSTVARSVALLVLLLPVVADRTNGQSARDRTAADQGYCEAAPREIVTSRTYRQDSRFAQRGSASVKLAELEPSDPGNRLLARGPAARLTAEMLRDQALAVSGLLLPTIGRPSVKPYQPPGLWEAVSYNGEDSYVADMGAGLSRRSLYTYVKRQAPPPSLLTFDGPTREKCTMRRPATNTPLRALLLLNDVTFVEAARSRCPSRRPCSTSPRMGKVARG